MSMEHEEIAHPSVWMGKATEQEVAERGLPTCPEDIILPAWFDREQGKSEAVLSDKQLAYCHRFLRTDLHVLVVLATAHLGLGRSSEYNEFFRKMDLEGTAAYPRDMTNSIQRELASCIHGGFGKDPSHPYNPIEHNEVYPTLVAGAGHLFQFSKQTDKPLSAFIGPAVSFRPGAIPMMYDGMDVRYTVDRINMLRSFGQLWKEQKYVADFSTTQKVLADTMQTSAQVTDRHVTRLKAEGLLDYSSRNARDGSTTTYKLNPDFQFKSENSQTHGSIFDFVREYIAYTQSAITAEGAYAYLEEYHLGIIENYQHNTKSLQVKLREVIYDLVGMGTLVSETPFKFAVNSRIAFTRSAGQLWLVEYLRTLDAMQSEDLSTEKDGMVLGHEIAVDREGLTRIFRKLDKIYPKSYGLSKNGLVFTAP